MVSKTGKRLKNTSKRRTKRGGGKRMQALGFDDSRGKKITNLEDGKIYINVKFKDNWSTWWYDLTSETPVFKFNIGLKSDDNYTSKLSDLLYVNNYEKINNDISIIDNKLSTTQNKYYLYTDVSIFIVTVNRESEGSPIKINYEECYINPEYLTEVGKNLLGRQRGVSGIDFSIGKKILAEQNARDKEGEPPPFNLGDGPPISQAIGGSKKRKSRKHRRKSRKT